MSRVPRPDWLGSCLMAVVATRRRRGTCVGAGRSGAAGSGGLREPLHKPRPWTLRTQRSNTTTSPARPTQAQQAQAQVAEAAAAVAAAVRGPSASRCASCSTCLVEVAVRWAGPARPPMAGAAATPRDSGTASSVTTVFTCRRCGAQCVLLRRLCKARNAPTGTGRLRCGPPCPWCWRHSAKIDVAVD